MNEETIKIVCITVAVIVILGIPYCIDAWRKK